MNVKYAIDQINIKLRALWERQGELEAAVRGLVEAATRRSEKADHGPWPHVEHRSQADVSEAEHAAADAAAFAASNDTAR